MNSRSISSLASVWAEHSEALADWTLSRIFVRRDVYGINRADGSRLTGHGVVNRDLLIRHYAGKDSLGAHLTSPDNLCLNLIADVDAHTEKDDPQVNWACVNLVIDTLAQFKLTPLICDSNGKGGYHVRQFFKKPVPSEVAYWLGRQIRERLKVSGLPDIEVFPKGDAVTLHTPYGNWVRLPGKHHKRDHYTRIYLGKWLDGADAISAILKIAGDDASCLIETCRSQQIANEPSRKNGRIANHEQRPDEEKVRSALSVYRNTDVSQDEWCAVGMCLNDWDQIRGLAVWRDWSAQSSKHHPANHHCEDRWKRFHPGGGLTIASIFKKAIDLGWEYKPTRSNGRLPQKTVGEPIVRQIAEKAEISGAPILLRNGRQQSCQTNSKIWLMSQIPAMRIYYDEFRRTYFVNDSVLTDELIISLRGKIEESLYTAWCKEDVRDALTDIGKTNTVNSLTDWLDSLSWDGEARINSFFHEAYGCDLDPYTSECGRILFLSGVARAFEPGCQSDVMVVMIGRQGTGKSMGIASLSPFPEWYADDLGCDLFEGRAGEGLQGKWIFEFSEFARINRSTLETVKSFVSRRVDHYRPPYGRIAQDFKRSCIFIGTTNNQHPLMDLENRRFMPIYCQDGKVWWINKNRENLWAEAVRRYRDGEQWWITDPEIQEACGAKQEASRLDDAWEMILSDRLERRPQTTMEEAALQLGIKADRLDRSTQTRIGFALSALGFTRKRIRDDGKRSYVYERTIDEDGPSF